MTKEQEAGPIVDSDGTRATRRVRCAICESCWEHPRAPGTCIYGGPFVFSHVNVESKND